MGDFARLVRCAAVTAALTFGLVTFGSSGQRVAESYGDSPAAANTDPASDIVPVVASRLLDSRVGVSGVVERVGAGEVVAVPVLGRGGVSGDAVGVLLNVTVVGPSGPGYVTVFPCGSDRPVASNVNYGVGDVVANAVFVGVGVLGEVCVFSLAEIDVLVDVTGFVPGGAGASGVVPVVASRLLDSRVGVSGVVERVGAGEVVAVPVLGRGGVSGDAVGVLLNVTVVGPSGPGYVTVFPCGSDRPVASNVNYGVGDVVANAVFVGVGVLGEVCVFSLAEIDVLVDVTGFVPGGAGASGVVPVVASRLLDSRVGVSGVVERVGAGEVVAVPVLGRGGVSGDAVGVLLNVTVVGPSGPGYVTVFPCGSDRPVASNVNYGVGDVVANAVFVGVGVLGEVCVFSLAEIDVLVDVTGFVPPGSTVATTTTTSTTIEPSGSPDTSVPPSTTVPPAAPETEGTWSYFKEFTDGDQTAAARWNPCEPIEYVVNTTWGSPAQYELMNQAIADIERATALDFVFAGITTEGLDGEVPAGADVLLAISNPEASPTFLSGNNYGRGGSQSGSWNDAGTLRAIRWDGVAIIDEAAGLGGRMLATWRHELGHLVGLGHVGDSNELMYGFYSGRVEFNGGDLAGLWHVGASQPCIPAPPFDIS